MTRCPLVYPLSPSSRREQERHLLLARRLAFGRRTPVFEPQTPRGEQTMLLFALIEGRLRLETAFASPH